MLRIEPVGAADLDRALVLLVGGPGRSAAGFEALLWGPEAGRCDFWWACGPRGPMASAMAVRNPGRTAMVFHSMPAGRGRIDALAGVLAALTEATVGDDVALVQALLPIGAKAAAAAFERAGYLRLGRLTYMERRLEDSAGQTPCELEWVAYSPGMESELAEVISDTYADSLDCPGLLGLRGIDDVIAGHKAGGIFLPECWWMPVWKGRSVGCVLVNDSAGARDAAEVVYLGVRPAMRRRGFGKAMLRQAICSASRRGLKKLNLAVDSANVPAVTLYRKEGFRRIGRREVFVRHAGS